MKISNPNVHKWHRVSINQRRTKDGSPLPGLVISQRGAVVLLSPEEWEDMKRAGDAILGINKPAPTKRC